MARSPVAARVVGRAALDPRDREDARRGHPAVDLTAFARARGLEPLGSLDPSGYAAALPMEPELQSNVVRGTVGGRDVVLWHWRYPWPLDDDGPVGRWVFHDRVSVQRSSLRSWFTGSGEEQYVGVPCTGVAALVPEAGLLPHLTVHCGPGAVGILGAAVAVARPRRRRPAAGARRGGGPPYRRDAGLDRSRVPCPRRPVRGLHHGGPCL